MDVVKAGFVWVGGFAGDNGGAAGIGGLETTLDAGAPDGADGGTGDTGARIVGGDVGLGSDGCDGVGGDVGFA